MLSLALLCPPVETSTTRHMARALASIGAGVDLSPRSFHWQTLSFFVVIVSVAFWSGFQENEGRAGRGSWPVGLVLDCNHTARVRTQPESA